MESSSSNHPGITYSSTPAAPLFDTRGPHPELALFDAANLRVIEANPIVSTARSRFPRRLCTSLGVAWLRAIRRSRLVTWRRHACSCRGPCAGLKARAVTPPTRGPVVPMLMPPSTAWTMGLRAPGATHCSFVPCSLLTTALTMAVHAVVDDLTAHAANALFSCACASARIFLFRIRSLRHECEPARSQREPNCHETRSHPRHESPRYDTGSRPAPTCRGPQP